MLKTTFAASTLLAATALAPANANPPALSQEIQTLPQEMQKLVITDLGEDFAQCWAYYDFMTAIIDRDRPDVDTNDSKKTGEFARDAALALVGKDVALANFKIALDSFASDTAGDTHRLSIVIANHAYHCKDLIDHPEHEMARQVEAEKAGAAAAAAKK